MNAGEVITLIVELSGRQDLLDDDGLPTAHAWFLLNASQRILDRKLGYPKEDAWLFKTLAAGETIVTFTAARYVKGVYHNDTRLGWQPAMHDHETEEAHWPLRAIELETASDEDRELKILAAWHSPKLSELTDVSFWTVQEEHLLAQVAQFVMEIHHKNSQGQQDFWGPIQDQLHDLYKDMMAEKMAGPPDEWRVGVYN